MSLAARFATKFTPEPMSGCWLWTAALDHNGYGLIGSGGKHGTNLQAHRVSWELHCGPIPDGQCVLHRCDTPSCVNPDHLFLGTQIENLLDMTQKGRRAPMPVTDGEANGRAKLTEADVFKIRRLRAAGVGGPTLAKQFGVDHKTVYRACSGAAWRCAAC